MLLFHRGAALAVLALATSGTSAHAASASASGRALLLQPLTATNVSNFDFGTIIPGASASTVQVLSTGARTCGGGLTCSGTTTAAGWLITTTANRQIYWNGNPTVTLTSGANTMTVSLLNLNSVHNMPASGSDTIHIGAILNVGANQADGVYTGSFTVDFDYS